MHDWLFDMNKLDINMQARIILDKLTSVAIIWFTTLKVYLYIAWLVFCMNRLDINMQARMILDKLIFVAIIWLTT